MSTVEHRGDVHRRLRQINQELEALQREAELSGVEDRRMEYSFSTVGQLLRTARHALGEAVTVWPAGAELWGDMKFYALRAADDVTVVVLGGLPSGKLYEGRASFEVLATHLGARFLGGVDFKSAMAMLLVRMAEEGRLREVAE